MKDIAEKAMLYDMWECVHKMDSVYDFDSSLSAEELKDNLSEIINLELLNSLNQ